jgi:tetraacyldisaccharide 4'-kinase
MSGSLDQFALEALSGRSRSWSARGVRTLTGVAEPGYAALMRVRNGLYDRGVFRVVGLGRPAVSVGNLTAGGTGKTPVVRWLAEAMRQRQRRAAILLRGYMRGQSVQSDEAAMLEELLNRGAAVPVEIEANADRVAGAAAVLARRPETELFILDDAFQHRRAGRNFDLVLIDATEPFGFGHVHPRGLLREPMEGLRRADALLLTRADAVSPKRLGEITDVLRRWNREAPIYRCAHHHAGLLDGRGAGLPIETLGKQRFFAFAGIGRPGALEAQLQRWGKSYVGGHWFNDHHTYTEQDLLELIAEARRARADALLTTDKDWVKLARRQTLWEEQGLPLWRLDLRTQFSEGDEERLLEQITASLGRISGGK